MWGRSVVYTNGAKPTAPMICTAMSPLWISSLGGVGVQILESGPARGAGEVVIYTS